MKLMALNTDVNYYVICLVIFGKDKLSLLNIDENTF